MALRSLRRTFLHWERIYISEAEEVFTSQCSKKREVRDLKSSNRLLKCSQAKRKVKDLSGRHQVHWWQLCRAWANLSLESLKTKISLYGYDYWLENRNSLFCTLTDGGKVFKLSVGSAKLEIKIVNFYFTKMQRLIGNVYKTFPFRYREKTIKDKVWFLSI